MPRGKKLPPKREVIKTLLAQGATFVHLDPRGDDVMVPDWLKHQPQLVLQIGLSMPVPIRDLRIDEDGVFGTLSFNRAPFTCLVPWRAVFALVGDDGRGMVWPESMPAEIAQEIEREAQRAGRASPQSSAPAATPSTAKAKREGTARARRAPEREETAASSVDEQAPVGLRLIEGEGGGHSSQRVPDLAARRRKAPHLRLIKR
jgi:stringent starvation protein B